jgi:DegV family protein with EDD domain
MVDKVSRSAIQRALTSGYERLAAWSDVLDRINVFPVPDGDTGRNLVLSLVPLQNVQPGKEANIPKLLLAARGNSGNIAANFFSGFLTASNISQLTGAAALGRRKAWESVSEPQAGTMLSVIDALCEALSETDCGCLHQDPVLLLEGLADTVRSTVHMLPVLEEAGVVDAGALGMYLFFEGFFCSLAGIDLQLRTIADNFQGLLSVSHARHNTPEAARCVDAVVDMEGADLAPHLLEKLGEDVVAAAVDSYLKLHFHTVDSIQVKQELASMGQLMTWEEDDMHAQVRHFLVSPPRQAMHIMTDAAGSLEPREAARQGVTLLNSYITIGDQCLPETYVSPQRLYTAMKSGIKVSTSQASLFERRQSYTKMLELYPWTLYLCVGSAYTGNYNAALEWKEKHDASGNFIVVDTGAASGRLGLMALAVSRFSQCAEGHQAVADFASTALTDCQEYIFLDSLKYLAAGGRAPKMKAWLGDALHMKPVITTTSAGVKKVGVTRRRSDQLRFALDKLTEALPSNSKPTIMLQFTDNESWISGEAYKAAASLFPNAEILVRPLSLTTGAHCGPGAWAMAFLPNIT